MVGKLTVYFDGQCQFCQAMRQKIEPYDSDQRLDFRDFNDLSDVGEMPFSLDQLRQEMYVQLPNGRWRVGFWGWLAILEMLPELRWLGAVLNLPPFRWLGPCCYVFIAKHRYQIPRFILTWLGVPPPCDESCSFTSHNKHKK